MGFEFGKIRYCVLGRMARYFCVGGVCFLVDFTLFLWLAKISGYNYLLINVFSFCVATALNYVLCTRYVFESGSKHKKNTEIFLLFLVSGFSLAFNQVFLFTFVEIFAKELVISKVLAVLLTFFFNFFGRSFLVFKAKGSVQTI
jgi:putative flippase GtrA